jgi:hypothetical protein
LSGLIRCMKCGHSMWGHGPYRSKPRKNGERIRTLYYACGGYVSGGKAVCPRVLFRREPLEADILNRIGLRVDWFLHNGGGEKLRALVAKGIKGESSDIDGEIKEVKRQLRELNETRRRLIASLTPANKEILDEEFESLKSEKKALETRLAELKSLKREEVDVDAVVDEIMATVRRFEDLFPYGTLQQQKEFVNLWVDHIEIDPIERRGKVYMNRFPAPRGVTGNPSVGMVAGARFEPATFGL